MRHSTGASDYKGILTTSIPSSITSEIRGNALTELKELAIRWYDILNKLGNYVRGVRQRLDITEVSVLQNAGEERVQVKMVCELDVLPGQCIVMAV